MDICVSFDQSGSSPLTSLINIAFLPAELMLTGHFLFSATFSVNPNCCVWKSQDISSYWDIQTTLSGTNNHSTVKVTKITFLSHSDIWSEKQLYLLTMSACCYAFSWCHMIGWLNTLPCQKKKFWFWFKSANCHVMIWGCFSWSGLGIANQQSSWMYWMTRLSHQWIFSSKCQNSSGSSCERVEHEDT